MNSRILFDTVDEITGHRIGEAVRAHKVFMEAQLCEGKHVIVIDGNSAGQAAVFLSQNTAVVTIHLLTVRVVHAARLVHAPLVGHHPRNLNAVFAAWSSRVFVAGSG